MKLLARTTFLVPLMVLTLTMEAGGEKYTTTPSGLRYLDRTVGQGAAVKHGTVVEVDYAGWLKNGVKVVGTDQGKTFRFAPGKQGVILGLEEGVIGMKAGGQRKLLIPAKLAHGAKGMPPAIPGDAELTVEITVVALWIETPTGLLFRDLSDGRSDTAKKGDTLEVHYTGWLADGKKFDSSLDREQPFKFTLGQGLVIKGWDEGVHGMKAGGKRRLIIPPHLGYGDKGAAGLIPPDAELTFEVELLKIE